MNLVVKLEGKEKNTLSGTRTDWKGFAS